MESVAGMICRVVFRMVTTGNDVCTLTIHPTLGHRLKTRLSALPENEKNHGSSGARSFLPIRIL